MQSWFSQTSVPADESDVPLSLLAEWNSYSASRDSQEGRGFDLESSMMSANESVSGTFDVVSKGMRDIPGNFQSAASSVPWGKALMYFGILVLSGVFFLFIAFTMFLPVIVITPQKFAICLIFDVFFALKGPKSQLAHMSLKESLPLTLGFLACMVGTIYVSMVLHNYILSVLLSVLHVSISQVASPMDLSALVCLRDLSFSYKYLWLCICSAFGVSHIYTFLFLFVFLIKIWENFT